MFSGWHACRPSTPYTHYVLARAHTHTDKEHNTTNLYTLLMPCCYTVTPERQTLERGTGSRREGKVKGRRACTRPTRPNLGDEVMVFRGRAARGLCISRLYKQESIKFHDKQTWPCPALSAPQQWQCRRDCTVNIDSVGETVNNDSVGETVNNESVRETCRKQWQCRRECSLMIKTTKKAARLKTNVGKRLKVKVVP